MSGHMAAFVMNGSPSAGPLGAEQATLGNKHTSEVQQQSQSSPYSSQVRDVDKNGYGQLVGGRPPSKTPGKTPPGMKVEYDDEDGDFTDESMSDTDLAPPAGKTMRVGDNIVDYSLASPGYSSPDSGVVSASKRASGPRSRKEAQLTPEEEERRKQRRERNKLAAAKCRQKRVDQTNVLMAETEVLEEEQRKLQEEINNFQRQKEELEVVLEAHRTHCGMGNGVMHNDRSRLVMTSMAQLAASAAMPLPSSSVTIAPIGISVTSSHETRIPVAQPGNVVSQPGACIPSAHPLPPSVHQAVGSAAMTSRRPNSFPVTSRGNGICIIDGALVIQPIITLGLDSMVDGHTGLTPLTGLPSSIVQTSQNFSTADAVATGDGGSLPTSGTLMHL